MNCREAESVLNASIDGELDLIRQVELEEHLTHCPHCAQQEQQLRLLRSAVSAAAPYYQAPESLRARIVANIAAEEAPLGREEENDELSESRGVQGSAVELPRAPHIASQPDSRGRRPAALRIAAVAAGILLAIGAGILYGPLFRGGPSADDRFADWIVASHVRSLQVEHLTDVVSSDRHTVKPWFRGKLDFSPQVPDLSKEGYPLKGGRLDYVADHAVAALVYQRRGHVINVFVSRASDDEQTAVRSLARQGFHLRTWQGSGLSNCAISDLNDQELDEFIREFRGHAPDVAP